MKINNDALAKAFYREWEVSVLPADFPDELSMVLCLAEAFIESAEKIDDLPQKFQSTIKELEVKDLFITKHDEEQEKKLLDAQEELYAIKQKLLDSDFNNDQINNIFKNVMEDMV